MSPWLTADADAQLESRAPEVAYTGDRQKIDEIGYIQTAKLHVASSDKKGYKVNHEHFSAAPPPTSIASSKPAVEDIAQTRHGLCGMAMRYDAIITSDDHHSPASSMPDHLSSAPVTNASRCSSRFSSACRPLFFGAALLCFAGMQVGAANTIDKENPLIGTWLLVKYVDTPENSAPIFAFGKEPVGHFIFTPGGHASFSIMRSPPDTDNPTSDPDPDACIPGWYCAYFGTYMVDVKGGVWVIHVQSANIPGFLNTDQPRHFTIDGDTLVVSETYLNGNTRIRAERVFVREPIRGLRGHRNPGGK